MVDKRSMSGLGIETSLLGFGCMRFPTDSNGAIDEKTAEKMIDDAISSGVNYIDTAYPYHNGESEPFVGRVLDKYPRESYFLATKLPCWQVGSLEEAEKLFESQLERLNKNYVDFYLLHSLNINTWRKMKELGVVEFCEKLKAQGKIRYLGFSFHDSYEAFEEILTYRRWDFCQIQYNYINLDHQAGMKGLKMAADRGLGVVVMEPLLGGKLANLSSHVAECLPEGKMAVESAFSFLWDQPEVSLLLSGMSTMEQVQENLRLADLAAVGMLSREDREALLKTKEVFDRMALVNCTACRYCVDHCPKGLDIPKLLSLYNEHTFTGGGFIENIPRMIPDGLAAEIELGTWPVLPIFDVLEKAGNIDHKEMYNIFNMGIGMVLAIDPARKDEALKLLADNNEPAYVLGQIAADTTGTQIVLK